MSAKAIELLIEKAEERAFRETLGSAMATAARAELEAIEKAAYMVAVVGQSEAAADRYAEWVSACELLRSIAKEAP